MIRNKHDNSVKTAPTKLFIHNSNHGANSSKKYYADNSNWNDEYDNIYEENQNIQLDNNCNHRDTETEVATNKAGVAMIITDEWSECVVNGDGSCSNNAIYTTSTTTRSAPSNHTNIKNNDANTTTVSKRQSAGLNDSSSCHRRASPTTSVPRVTRNVTSPVQALHSQQQHLLPVLSPAYGYLESCNSGLSSDSQNSSSCSSFGGYGYNSKDTVNSSDGPLLTPKFDRHHRIVRRKQHKKYTKSFLSFCFGATTRRTTPTITSPGTLVLHKQQRRQQRQHQPYFYHNSTNSSSMCNLCKINDIILVVCTFFICSFMAATSIFIHSGRLFTVSDNDYNNSNKNNVQRIGLLHHYGRLRPQEKIEIVISNTSHNSSNVPTSDVESKDGATQQHQHYLMNVPADTVNSKASTESIPIASYPSAAISNANDSIDADEWTKYMNPYGLVHVVQTRFMQYQPDLLSLGQARLQLFQSITIPSIAHQTNQNFLWIIRTDPNLHKPMLYSLLETLRTTFPPSSNMSVVLVASNSNPEGFRDDECIHDIRNATTLFGDYETVYRYHTAAQTHTVLETRLDADDAIATFYIDTLQQSAYTNFRVGWMVWCVENHLEWQYTSPWNYTTPTGAILGLKAIGCITPGLTWGYTVQSNRSSIPVSKHNKIAATIPSCHKKTYNKKLLRKYTYNPDTIKNGTGTCLHKLGNDVLPAALRARTPTSAGMDHVLLYPYTIKSTSSSFDKLKNSKWRTIQNEMFDSLPVLFGINSTTLFATRLSIQQHLPAIASDAYNGQCTKGHSCKQSAKDILFKLMNSTTDSMATTS